MMRDTGIWNEIDFSPWTLAKTRVFANEYCNEPVWLEIENYDASAAEAFSPNEARELAAKLIECADAADKAGECNAA